MIKKEKKKHMDQEQANRLMLKMTSPEFRAKCKNSFISALAHYMAEGNMTSIQAAYAKDIFEIGEKDLLTELIEEGFCPKCGEMKVMVALKSIKSSYHFCKGEGFCPKCGEMKVMVALKSIKSPYHFCKGCGWNDKPK
jgi:predicted RNA-binding Zn-ribbon protein involved in translation (DUF1610 family)